MSSALVRFARSVAFVAAAAVITLLAATSIGARGAAPAPEQPAGAAPETTVHRCGSAEHPCALAPVVVQA